MPTFLYQQNAKALQSTSKSDPWWLYIHTTEVMRWPRVLVLCCERLQSGLHFKSPNKTSKEQRNTTHTHEPDVDPPDQAGNLAEVSLRMFVTDHFEMDSRDIYSLILKGEVQNKYEHFPDAASITIKRIQNIL